MLPRTNQEIGGEVARAVFPVAEETIVLVLDRELARDRLVVRAITRVAERAHDAPELAMAVQGLAESLGWRICSQAHDGYEVMTLARA